MWNGWGGGEVGGASGDPGVWGWWVGGWVGSSVVAQMFLNQVTWCLCPKIDCFGVVGGKPENTCSS